MQTSFKSRAVNEHMQVEHSCDWLEQLPGRTCSQVHHTSVFGRNGCVHMKSHL